MANQVFFCHGEPVLASILFFRRASQGRIIPGPVVKLRQILQLLPSSSGEIAN
jgi:hypothetical protein